MTGNAARDNQVRATNLGSSGIVDDSIVRIDKTYDDLGRVETVTSYSDTSNTMPVNQIQYEYNGWGQVYREYQEHEGTVENETENETGTGALIDARLNQVTYPNGREVSYDYGQAQAVDDIMSRLSAIFDDANGDGDIDAGEDVFASYKYLGANRIVTEDYEDLEVKLDYSADDFAALDRFGRVVDQIWNDYGEDPDVTLDEYTYTYDRAGNRTSRDNELHAAFDEEYTYDDLDRLTDADRADSFDQSWTLDGLGNFSGFDDDGTSQTRTANAVNEITGISGAWIDPTYDDAGNMISGPKTGAESTRLHHVFDAWNRQTAVFEDDGDGTFEPGTDDDLIATYEYDGENRRIEKTFADDTGVEYFYNQNWQMLEERAVDDEGTATAINQYVWSARYIDAAVVRFHDGNGDGDLLDAGDNTRYYTNDANCNVTATIDAASGNVVERYVYNAYGKATVYDGNWANPAPPTTDGPLYCGYFLDGETALYQVRNRYYDSSLSTFISRDPVIYRAGTNVYAYLKGNPAKDTDPFGLCGADTDLAIINLVYQTLGTIPSWPFVGFPYHENNPQQHCVWNCRMARAFGEDFAEYMSTQKEEVDQAFCDIGNSISDDCWNDLPREIQRQIAAWCCSANQPSDFTDNAAGRSCANSPCLGHLSCEDCCSTQGIDQNTGEGPGTDRPYGPGCTERYQKAIPPQSSPGS